MNFQEVKRLYRSVLFIAVTFTDTHLKHGIWWVVTNGRTSITQTPQKTEQILQHIVPTSPLLKVFLATSAQPQILWFVCPCSCPASPVMSILAALYTAQMLTVQGFLSVPESCKQMLTEKGARWVSLSSLLQTAHNWRKKPVWLKSYLRTSSPFWWTPAPILIFMVLSAAISTCIRKCS